MIKFIFLKFILNWIRFWGAGNQVARILKAGDVEAYLTELFCSRGVLEHIGSDNGFEFTAKSIHKWLNELGTKTVYIEPGSLWENSYIESFNGKLRDELLNGEIFYTLQEEKILIEYRRREYNQIRPYRAPGFISFNSRKVIMSAITGTLFPGAHSKCTHKKWYKVWEQVKKAIRLSENSNSMFLRRFYNA